MVVLAALYLIHLMLSFIASGELANRFAKEIMEIAKDKPIYIYKGNNIELGAACGKPFGVSVITILDEGKSNIMNIIAKG